jgi:hypothetical protein
MKSGGFSVKTKRLSKRHGSEVSTPPKTSKRAKGTIQKKEGFIRF